MKTFLHKSAFYFLFICLGFVAISCDDDKDATVEPTPTATITISAPAENGFVTANDSATVSGTIQAAKNLHGYTISIRRKTDNVEIFRKESHAHNTTLSFSHKWFVEPVNAATELELELITALDHAGNTASKKVTFQARP